MHRHHPHYKMLKRRMRYIVAGMLAFFGILCFFMADEIRDGLSLILGGLLLILAGDNLYEAFADRHFNEEDTTSIANAIIYTILGIIVLLRRSEADSVVGAIWGILGLLLASRNISHSLYELIHRKGKTAGHILHLIHSLFSIFISILLLLDPVEHLLFHVYILGAELMDYAVRIAFEEE